MLKEKLSRPMDWVVSCLVAVVIALVANLFVPYPPSAPRWVFVCLSSLRYYLAVAALLLILRRRFGIAPRQLVSARWLSTLSYLFIWVTLLALFALLKYLLNPSAFTPNPGYTFLSPMLLGILLFTPVQTFTEELVFRCCLSRVTGNGLPGNTLAYSLVSGFLFMAAHMGNPVASSANGQPLRTIRILLYYFILGAFLMYISLRSHSFSPAIGIHMGNNLFIDLVLCQSSNPEIKNPAFLFSGDETYLLLTELVFCIVMTMLFHHLTNRKGKEARDAQA